MRVVTNTQGIVREHGIKVCMLTYSFYENDGRVKRYAESLASRGDEVDVISLRKKGQPAFETFKAVNVYRIQERTPDEKGKFSYLEKLVRFFLHSSYYLSKEHSRNPYNFIHVHSIPDFEVFAALLPKLSGCKIILDIHDIVPELYVSKFSRADNGMLFRALKTVEKLSCGFADHVIISNHIWEKKLCSRSVSPSRCTTLLNYPDPSIFFPRKRTRNDDKFIMMYPGTLNWHQGLDLAIEAFMSIAAQVPQAEFHIYGRGSELDKLREMADSAGLSSRILFQPPVRIEEVAELMANADLCIIPKRNDPFGGEAFSTKSLEFMSLGVPVIMSRTKIDSYYFNDSVVRFFEPENVSDLASAMLDLATNKTKRRLLVDNASKFVAEFSWEKKKLEYFSLVDRLTRKG
ncbi:MAG: glycosyltransferase family 4 protein [Syntrophobacterales bacterium]|jgi:glycosyltransferase involved in cell wall biosynthesis|nr:glycosyltransferase family 4 protein [Syntrophobacterales bacterium]